MSDVRVVLEPVLAGHQTAIERFPSEPDSLTLDWSGFGDLAAFRVRLRTDGHIGAHEGLCDYLFQHTTAERIEAVVRVDNEAEHRTLEAIVFSRDAVLARAQFKQGGWRDLVLCSVLRPEPT